MKHKKTTRGNFRKPNKSHNGTRKMYKGGGLTPEQTDMFKRGLYYGTTGLGSTLLATGVYPEMSKAVPLGALALGAGVGALSKTPTGAAFTRGAQQLADVGRQCVGAGCDMASNAWSALNDKYHNDTSRWGRQYETWLGSKGSKANTWMDIYRRKRYINDLAKSNKMSLARDVIDEQTYNAIRDMTVAKMRPNVPLVKDLITIPGKRQAHNTIGMIG